MKKPLATRDPNPPIDIEKLWTVARWYKRGHFRNDDEARGGVRLAHQQYLDGAGRHGLAPLMGLTEDELHYWMGSEALPAIPPEHRQAARRWRNV